MNSDNYTLVNAARLFSPDCSENEDLYDLTWRLLRPEFVIDYNDGQLHEDYRLFTWKNPIRCDECQLFIDDFE